MRMLFWISGTVSGCVYVTLVAVAFLGTEEISTFHERSMTFQTSLLFFILAVVWKTKGE